MAGYWKFLIGMAAVAAGISGSYLLGDYRGYHRSFSARTNDCVYGGTLEVESHLSALKNFRAGKTAEGIETIEARLDSQLLLMDPQHQFQPLNAITLAQIQKTIQNARAYRLAHPRKSKRSGIDTLVSDLFKRN